MFAKDNLVGATRLVRVRGKSSVQTCVDFGTQFWLVPRRASQNTSDLIYRLNVCLLLRTIYTVFTQNTQFSEEKNGFQQYSIVIEEYGRCCVVSEFRIVDDLLI